MTMGDREVYRDCMRNHAATLGTYATDGCGEFTPSPASEPLRCAACGCHRNFHRKVADALLESSAYQKRRSRTKFSPEQKESMLRFSEKIGWRIPRRDGDVDEVAKFCKEIGVGRQVFKVWMHNHKSDNANYSATSSSNAANADGNNVDNGVRMIMQ